MVVVFVCKKRIDERKTEKVDYWNKGNGLEI